MSRIPMKRDEGGPIPAEWKLRCLECGYDLTGLTNRVCPECGQHFNPRETWEANQSGAGPRSEAGQSRIVHLLIVAGIVIFVLAGGQRAGELWAAVTAAIVIVLGELWIFKSDVRPVVARILVGALCVFLLMWVLIP